jgi:hypothetical protein
LGDPKVGSVDRHQAVVANVIDEPYIKINLQFYEGGEQEMREKFGEMMRAAGRTKTTMDGDDVDNDIIVMDVDNDDLVTTHSM